MKRISEEKKQQVVDEYLSAKLSQAEFCTQKGVCLSSLQRWLRTYKGSRSDKGIKARAPKCADRFVEAVIGEPAKVQLIHRRQMLTIRTPGGYVIEVPI